MNSMHGESQLPGRYRNRWQATQLYGSDADHYAGLYLSTDPPADQLVEWLSSNREHGEAAFERALHQGVAQVDDPPDVLRQFFEEVEAIPTWVDFDEINRGALVYQRFGIAGMIILSAWSLLNGYHSSAAVKPLAMTGQLRHSPQRRLGETARFVSEATQLNGLRRGRPGHEITVRVRLIHAYVRRACMNSEDWNASEWGIAINQADMFGTLLEFSLLVMDGVRRLGFTMTDDEAHAILSLWRYCGHLSGVDPWLLSHLASETETRRIADLIHLVQPGPDDDSLALAEALLHVPGQNAPGQNPNLLARLIMRVHHGLARALNGPEIADNLSLPDDVWQYVEYPARAIIGPFEAIRRRVPGASRVAAHIGNQAIRRDLQRILRGTEPDFLL
ncbi:MAG: oxygenase MpaB family protein [Polyangiales bacterium]